MNDYQQRESEKSAELRAELKPIAKALGWELRPNDPSLDEPPSVFYFSNDEGLEIRGSVMWTKTDRFEFDASEWPTYTDEKGQKCRVIPHELGGEWRGNSFVKRETTPTTTAARSRSPEAIAKQIKTKLIPEYQRVYKLLAELAKSHQVYANREADTITRLFEATQEERRDNSKLPYFIRNMAGDTVTIEYRSPGSIKIDLSADDMCAVIEFLRAKRNAGNV